MPARTRLLALFTLLFAGIVLGADDKLKELEKELKDKKDGNSLDRQGACRSLGSIGSKEAAMLLAMALSDDLGEVRDVATWEMGGLKDKEALAWVSSVALFDQKEEMTRANSAKALGIARYVEAADQLAKACANDRSPVVRAEAAESLGALGNKDAVPALTARLKDSSGEVRAAAAGALGMLKAKEALDALKVAAEDHHAEARAAALRALAATNPAEAVPILQGALKAKEAGVRIAALDSLVVAETSAADPALRELLDDKEWTVRAAAVAAALEVRYREDVDALIARLEKETGRLRLDIVTALRDLTGKEIGFDPRDWKNWWEGARDSFKVKPKKGTPGLIEESAGNGGKSRASFFNIPILSERLAFIIDMSGSMDEVEERDVKDEHTKDEETPTRLALAKKEMYAAIRQLEEKVRFNIVVMNTRLKKEKEHMWMKSLAPASEGNKNAARKWFEKTEDEWKTKHKKYGRGDMYDAMMAAMDDPEIDTLFVLSDGIPTAGDHVVEESVYQALDRANRTRRVVVHTVLTATRSKATKDFMESLATRTGGIFVQR